MSRCFLVYFGHWCNNTTIFLVPICLFNKFELILVQTMNMNKLLIEENNEIKEVKMTWKKKNGRMKLYMFFILIINFIGNLYNYNSKMNTTNSTHMNKIKWDAWYTMLQLFTMNAWLLLVIKFLAFKSTMKFKIFLFYHT